jgi:hypothetical protein
MMSAYDWDLIERLLHKVQESAGETFTPRVYADELATELEQAGQTVGNLDTYKKTAADYEALLYKGGFIEARPEEDGGNGENFVLTPRGSQLLRLIARTSPGSEGPRALLDEKGLAALVPEVFDQLAGDLARSSSVP